MLPRWTLKNTMKQHYEKNKDAKKLTWKQHYEKNKDAKKLTWKQHYEKNKDAKKMSRNQLINVLTISVEEEWYIARTSVGCSVSG